MPFGNASLTVGRIVLIAVVLLGWCLPASAQEADARLPVPAPAVQAKSSALVRELYQEEFDRIITRSQRGKVAGKLIDQAVATRQDPTGRYVLLDVAMRTAVDAGDVAKAFLAIDELARYYRVDGWESRTAVLTRMAESAKRKIERQTLAASALRAIDGAIDGNDYPIAERLVEVALEAAKQARDGELIRQIAAKADAVKKAAEAERALQDVLAMLRQKPVDP
ncbi:MAG: hypothetical protein ABIK89_14380, partial [Planctomycetota bacterium]